VTLSSTSSLFTALLIFDVAALLAAAAGGLVSWQAWQRARKNGGDRHPPHAREGRNRFLAMWGMLSSLWFFFAILFNIIASVTVPPCLS